MHCPLEQCCPSEQARPQTPQLRSSVCSSTQLTPQHVAPLTQVEGQPHEPGSPHVPEQHGLA